MPTFNYRILRAWRLESGIRPEEVCYRAGISFSYLRTLEDRGGNPRAIVLATLAEIYGRNLGELYTLDPDPEPDPAGAR